VAVHSGQPGGVHPDLGGLDLDLQRRHGVSRPRWIVGAP
jgi:hypothetical protein